jgi:3-hydroxyisobutyrate dehydrogenase
MEIRMTTGHTSASTFGDLAVGRVVVLGLGRMGLPMAEHMRRAGIDVVGYDPLATARAAFEALGGATDSILGDVATSADVALVIVGSESDAEHLILDESGLCAWLRPGSVIVVASTVRPTLVRRFGERASERDIAVVDAPLCRGEHGAKAADLLAFVSGPEPAYQRIAPILRTFSSDISYFGDELGRAQVAKTINNLILWTCVVATDEGLRIGEAWGLEREVFVDALRMSSADNYAMRHWHLLDHWVWSAKDMRIALDVAGERRIAAPLSGLISQLVRQVEGLPHAS